MEKCIICNSEKNLIPAGISKRTGKAYQAFYSCPKGCKTPYPTSKPSSEPDGFKIMADEFVNLKDKIDELIKELQQNLLGQ